MLLDCLFDFWNPWQQFFRYFVCRFRWAYTAGLADVVMTVPAVAATAAPTPREAATAPRRPPLQVKLQQTSCRWDCNGSDWCDRAKSTSTTGQSPSDTPQEEGDAEAFRKFTQRPTGRTSPGRRGRAPDRVEVKKMPRKPGRFVKVKTEQPYSPTGLLKRRGQAEKRRNARKSWRQRQREALEFFSAKRKAEEQAPAAMYEIHRGARLSGQRKIVKRMYNPTLNRNEEIPVNPKSLTDGSGPFVKSFTGFSNKNPKGLKCGHCGQRGHLISSCPGIERRVSLTQNRVTLTPRGQHNPDSEVAADGISPHDSVSQVGLTAETLRLHNRRLRGHGWDVTAPKTAEKPSSGKGWGHGARAPSACDTEEGGQTGLCGVGRCCSSRPKAATALTTTHIAV